MFIFIIFLKNFYLRAIHGPTHWSTISIKNQGEESSFKWYLFASPTSSNLIIFVYLCYHQGKALQSIRYIKLFGKAFLGIYKSYTGYSITFCTCKYRIQKKNSHALCWGYSLHIMFRNIVSCFNMFQVHRLSYLSCKVSPQFHRSNVQ